MLHHLLDWFSNEAQYLTNTFGHWGIFFAMVIESACIPLPSEVIMLIGGFQAAQGHLNFWLVIVAGVLGNLVGSLITYWIGAAGGRPLLMKYGKFLLIKEKHIVQAERWFNRYGDWAVFFGRNLPFIRTFISLPAGIARMPFGRFFFFTLVGCLPWDIALTYIGKVLGANWDLVEPYMKPISYGLAALVVLLIVWFFIKNIRARFAH